MTEKIIGCMDKIGGRICSRIDNISCYNSNIPILNFSSLIQQNLCLIHENADSVIWMIWVFLH